MSKIKLGARPKNFTRVVSFPMLDGTTGKIEVTFKYRTKTEFGRFLDGNLNAAKAKLDEAQRAAEASVIDDFAGVELADAASTHQSSYQFQFQNQTAEFSAQFIMDIAESWNLDVKLTYESAFQLSDELPAAAKAIVDVYRAAITEGRLGN